MQRQATHDDDEVDDEVSACVVFVCEGEDERACSTIELKAAT